MTHNQKSKKSGDHKGKNLILVNSSDNYQDVPLGYLFSRNSSKSVPDFLGSNSSVNNLFQSFQDPERDREKEAKSKMERKIVE